MRQWLRACRFLVGKGNSGIDFSGLRIVFDVKKNDLLAPNTASVKVYNANERTVGKVIKEFDAMHLEVGYRDGSLRVVYSGTVIQAFRYREGPDTVLELVGGDGDRAYTYGIVNATMSAGSTPASQLKAAVGMQPDLLAGTIAQSGTEASLPRGKVMFGPFRDLARRAGKNMGSQVYIDSGKLMAVPGGGVLPGDPVELSPETGLVQSAQQTIDGVQCQCLINPNVRIGALIHLDASYVVEARRDNQQTTTSAMPISKSGYYRVISCQYQGDTRGGPWYCKITGVAMDMTARKTRDTRGDDGGH